MAVSSGSDNLGPSSKALTDRVTKVQIDAVHAATGISKGDLEKIISKYTEGRTLGVFGEPRVNVLKVNLEVASILKIR